MTQAQITTFYKSLVPLFNERLRRLFAAMLAQSLGRGGIRTVSEATGVARSTIGRGLRELESISGGAEPGNHVRRPGGGRKRATETDPTLLEDLRKLVDPATRGDPESPLLWSSKSTRQLAKTLREQGHKVSHETVRLLLKEMGFTLQGLCKTKEGRQHPDRNAQFEHIAAQVKKFMNENQPVISVDTKKKELVGDFDNQGQEWQPKGEPEQVRAHDFVDKELGKAIPYGVYDVAADEGWVSVGIDHDTAAFAVATIKTWWQQMGSKRYTQAHDLLITADGGGSNSSRGKLWKKCLQDLADELGLRIWVCHYPPGTSKWNKIEHRMFSRITQNWRGRPLLSIEVIVSLIANTRLKNGNQVRSAQDSRKYPKGVTVGTSELEEVRLLTQEFHGEWNYVILPKAECPEWNDAVVV